MTGLVGTSMGPTLALSRLHSPAARNLPDKLLGQQTGERCGCGVGRVAEWQGAALAWRLAGIASRTVKHAVENGVRICVSLAIFAFGGTAASRGVFPDFKQRPALLVSFGELCAVCWIARLAGKKEESMISAFPSVFHVQHLVVHFMLVLHVAVRDSFGNK